MRFFLAILLFCIVFIAGCGETNGCQPDWSNDCESNSNCCSGYCDNNDSIQWKTGVCKKDQEGSGDGKTKGASNLINWQPGDWAMDCDFFGNDMSSCQVPSERCTETCRETVGCTHFTWTDYKEGTCWMKKGSINKSEAEFKSGAVCGTVNTTTTTTTSTSMTTTTIAITKSCKPDFSTDCESNSDCCSGYCDHNHVEWHKGVCKNNTESSLTDLRLRGGKSLFHSKFRLFFLIHSLPEPTFYINVFCSSVSYVFHYRGWKGFTLYFDSSGVYRQFKSSQVANL